jgi:hypothetical protein
MLADDLFDRTQTGCVSASNRTPGNNLVIYLIQHRELAVIKSVTYYVDRKSVRDAEEAGMTYGHLSDAELDYIEFDPDDTLAVGEQEWLINYHKPHGGKVNQKTIEKFADFIDQNLAVGPLGSRQPAPA